MSHLGADIWVLGLLASCCLGRLRCVAMEAGFEVSKHCAFQVVLCCLPEVWDVSFCPFPPPCLVLSATSSFYDDDRILALWNHRPQSKPFYKLHLLWWGIFVCLVSCFVFVVVVIVIGFFFFWFCLEIRFLYVTLAVLKHTLFRAGWPQTQIRLLLFPERWDQRCALPYLLGYSVLL